MLPPRLAAIRNNLITKPEYNRSRAEKELLVELEELDRRGTTTEALNEIKKRTSIFSGPGGGCPCCGRGA